jgi:hypothetical protein
MTRHRHTDEIQARIDAIRQDKRSRIKWKISQHTAELAIRAIEGHVRFSYMPGTKSHRRKKHKRLL